MALYRAKRAGQHPDGTAKFVREGETFEWAGRPGAWMELAEEQNAPSPAPSEDHKEEIAVALNEAPLAEAEPESAPKAESKRKARKGAE